MDRPDSNLLGFLNFLRKELLKQMPAGTLVELVKDEKPQRLRVVALPVKEDKDVEEFKRRNFRKAA